jgi:uncharacterized protein
LILKGNWKTAVISDKPLKMLVLSLTGRCNFACKYCYAEAHPQDMMSLDTAVQAVDLAAASGEPFVLQFSGGEPLMAYDVMQKIIQYVDQRRIRAIMQLQTNASLLNLERVSYLRQAKVGIGISLDGRPKINDQLRCLPNGKGTSCQIVRGAGYLAALGMEIGITCVIANENVNQLAGIVEMAHYLGNVRRIGFDLLRGQGRGEMLTPPPADAVAKGLLEALRTAEQLARFTGQTMRISQLERVEKLACGRVSKGFGHCHAMNGEAAFVDARGRIYACSSLVGDEDFRLGDVSKGIDKARQQAVMELIQNSMVFCLECPDFTLCGGGCFARWYGSGCIGKAYEAECALKKVCIQWYQQQRETSI